MTLNNLTDKLRNDVVENLLSKKDELDKPYIVIGNKAFTRQELANELDDETRIGIDVLSNLVQLTLDLLNRGKIKG